MQLFERCRLARRRTGLSQEALALEMGVSRGAVAQWEMASGTVPNVANLAALSVRSGVMFEWLATGRGAMIHGAPQVSEESSAYVAEGSARDDDELTLLKRFRSSNAEKKKAILALLK